MPDDDHPYGTLTAFNADGEKLGQARTPASYKLTPSGAVQWIENDFRKP